MHTPNSLPTVTPFPHIGINGCQRRRISSRSLPVSTAPQRRNEVYTSNYSDISAIQTISKSLHIFHDWDKRASPDEPFQLPPHHYETRSFTSNVNARRK